MDTNYDDIFSSEECRNYINACYECALYNKEGTLEPRHVTKRFKVSRRLYRIFLDNVGMKMPKPIFPYDPLNTKTWKYLDCMIHDNKFGKGILNPDWIYRDKPNLLIKKEIKKC